MSTKVVAISVLMPVYNAELFLSASIDSILAQSFPDFELIIVNDGSTDRSEQIILSYTDQRIRYFKNEANLGLIASLNKGIYLSNGKYIARMDADDISARSRLKKQFSFMENHPEIGVCGTWHDPIGVSKKMKWRGPVSHECIVAFMFIDSPFSHPTVIIRKSVLFANNVFYNPEYPRCEDYKLWIDLSTVTRFANIPEVLLKYRTHDQNESQRSGNRIGKIRQELIEKITGRNINDSDKEMMQYLYFDEPINEPAVFRKILSFYHEIKNRNREMAIYPEPHFKNAIDEHLQKIFSKMIEGSIKNGRYRPVDAWKVFKTESKFGKLLSFRQRMKIYVKCFIYWSPDK